MSGGNVSIQMHRLMVPHIIIVTAYIDIYSTLTQAGIRIGYLPISFEYAFYDDVPHHHFE